jgi:hypothetical protein
MGGKIKVNLINLSSGTNNPMPKDQVLLYKSNSYYFSPNHQALIPHPNNYRPSFND